MSKRIAASPPRVFEVFSDLARAPEAVEGIKKLEILTSGPVGKGTRFRETRVMFGREATEEMEITEFEPGRSYTVGCDAHGTRYVTRYDFHADGEGTRVDMRFDATPLSLLAKAMSLMAKPFMKGLTRQLDRDLEDLKAAAERPA